MSRLLKTISDPGQHRLWTGVGVGLVMLLTVLCYWPSLNGPFLFDDIPNLQLMGAQGGLDKGDNYREFVFGGQSGPLGRPLALASFAMDGQTWPTDPRPFRISNLILHLFNGLLIFLLARQIFATGYQRETASWLALLCMSLWILHPLLVSTTAYVIQRMTLLTSLFTLTGLLCFMRGRRQLAESPGRGWAWLIGGMGISGVLAILSKESGVLLPLYALVIELTVFNSMQLPQGRRKALLAVLLLPVLAIVAYLGMSWNASMLGFEFRPFTLLQRLLTQAVVLVDYLGQIVAPQLSGLGVIHDDFPVSKGLLDPPLTAIALLGLTVVAVSAVISRKKLPFVSLGILWFLAGHSLESGPVPLELYFEHRNYLPLLGVMIAVCSLLPQLSHTLRRVVPLILILFFCLEAFTTWQSASLWGNERLLLKVTALEHPQSLRAQQYLVNDALNRGDIDQALAMQERLLGVHPGHATTQLSILTLNCIRGTLTPELLDKTNEGLAVSKFDLQLVSYLGSMVATAANEKCAVLNLTAAGQLLDTMLANPAMRKNASLTGAARYQKGLVYHSQANLRQAIVELDLSYAANPDLDLRLQQIVWLLSAGEADEAQRYLSLARQHRAGGLWPVKTRRNDIETLQKQIDLARNRN